MCWICTQAGEQPAVINACINAKFSNLTLNQIIITHDATIDNCNILNIFATYWDLIINNSHIKTIKCNSYIKLKNTECDLVTCRKLQIEDIIPKKMDCYKIHIINYNQDLSILYSNNEITLENCMIDKLNIGRVVLVNSKINELIAREISGKNSTVNIISGNCFTRIKNMDTFIVRNVDYAILKNCKNFTIDNVETLELNSSNIDSIDNNKLQSICLTKCIIKTLNLPNITKCSINTCCIDKMENINISKLKLAFTEITLLQNMPNLTHVTGHNSSIIFIKNCGNLHSITGITKTLIGPSHHTIDNEWFLNLCKLYRDNL